MMLHLVSLFCSMWCNSRMDKKAVIREYTKDDKSAVIDLFRLNTPMYFSPAEEDDLVYYLENEIEYYFVVECENEIAGCGGINYSEDKTIGKISWDIFHPDHQGKGHGSRLLDFRIKKLEGSGHIQAISVRTSQLAWQFYGRYGFKLVEVVKDHWAKGFDMYRMEYSITPLFSTFAP